MIGRALLALAVLMTAEAASAQLIPVTTCNAAIPCNIPVGLRPWRAARWTPGVNSSHPSAAISVFSPIAQGLELHIATQPVPEEVSDQAARIFLRNHSEASRVQPVLKPQPTAPEP